MTWLLAFAAGALTTLNPCVLPMLPLLALGGDGSLRGTGPVAAGLVISFTAIGLGVAAMGSALGLDPELFRRIAAAALIMSGLALAHRPTRSAVARLLSPLAGRATEAASEKPRHGTVRRFGLGVLLGAIWSPCTGPTLAAATALAAGRQSLPDAAGVMALFATGMAAVFGLAAVALSRWSPARRRALAAAGGRGRDVLGWSLVAIGVLVVSGGDRVLEAWLTRAMPAWVIGLTTSL